uniref:Small ribosomal subunit protein mS26 n=1 Tax=Strongyloides papillosus TaxID=174720 RepID=A0A0N5CBZ9_STREA
MFSKSFLSQESVLISSVRLLKRQVPKHGKPPILPPSKKILYNVVNVPWEKKEIVEELLWRRHVYNNVMLSLRKVFSDEVDMIESAESSLKTLRVKEKEEFERCILLNEERNERLRAERKARAETEMRETKEKLLEKIETALEDEDKNVALRKEEVLRLIKQSPNFITKENLDAKLEEALDNPISYDFAIDLEGRRTDDLPRFI